MRVESLSTPWAVAKRGAAIVAEESRAAVAARGQFLLALSGGKSPWKMILSLAKESVPWEHVHVFQVDERVAPEGHPDRNLTTLREILLTQTPLTEPQIHAMPVDDEDLVTGAALYAQTLRTLAGTPALLDLVTLGLGVDGHTASLIPGDPALEAKDRDVALTEPHFGRPRITLTYPILNRARRILWIVTGEEKAKMIKRLLNADPAIPAGLIRQDNATLVIDETAMPG
ncbi:MAG: 6-phosphogluconolactonase [Elusimicrobia bacterium]|nr:6-phosphogluconolactonase [Elusimicrobiota bacterium]